MTVHRRVVLVVDYQNAHQVGHKRFASAQKLRSTLLDPGLLGDQLMRRRAIDLTAPRPGYTGTPYDPEFDELTDIFVFRGLPHLDRDPRGHAANLAQQVHWQEDSRVSVTLRPLTYQPRDRCPHDPPGGISDTVAREKGVDVLVAMKLAEIAHKATHDVAILFCQDSDLTPALELTRGLGPTRIEAAGWFKWLSHNVPGVWQSRLLESDFVAARDTFKYPRL